MNERNKPPFVLNKCTHPEKSKKGLCYHPDCPRFKDEVEYLKLMRTCGWKK